MNKEEAEKLLDALMERLAAIEHDRWAHWQRYMHSKAERLSNGALVIPPDLAAQWEQQFQMPYDALTEREKESDREQVRRYLPIIADALAQNIR